MIELFPLHKPQTGAVVVSARALYKYLEIGTDFTTWCKRMFDYGFQDGIDYHQISVAKNGDIDNQVDTMSAAMRNAHGISIDYVLTLRCAKEIAMVQRSDKGKAARQYFIECEREFTALAAKPIQQDSTYIDRLRKMAANLEEEERIDRSWPPF